MYKYINLFQIIKISKIVLLLLFFFSIILFIPNIRIFIIELVSIIIKYKLDLNYWPSLMLRFSKIFSIFSFLLFNIIHFLPKLIRSKYFFQYSIFSLFVIYIIFILFVNGNILYYILIHLKEYLQ